jgi:hypothetical protein
MAASETILGLIHEAVAADLLRHIQTGEASPQVIAQAIKFLKDNGIEAVAVGNDKLGQLAKSMPDFDAEEPLHAKH